MRARKVRGKRPTEARLPASRKAGSAARPTPKTEEEARLAIIRALCGHDSEASTSLALDLCNLEQQSPQAYNGAVRGLANIGYLLGLLMERGSLYTRNIAKIVMAYRRQVIKELEITTAAEFMLLDAAMDAYVHWLEASALVRVSSRDGTNDSKARLQARLGGMAQSYLRTYMDAMKTLADLKQPPIRVLKVEAGQTVAVQVNERPAGPQVGGPAKGLPHVERRNLLESAPADATPAVADHG